MQCITGEIDTQLSTSLFSLFPAEASTYKLSFSCSFGSRAETQKPHEGQNPTIEFRFGEDSYPSTADLAVQFVVQLGINSTHNFIGAILSILLKFLLFDRFHEVILFVCSFTLILFKPIKNMNVGLVSDFQCHLCLIRVGRTGSSVESSKSPFSWRQEAQIE